MSDKLNTLYPIEARFTPGEQPTANKLTILLELARKGLSDLEKVIGDAKGTSGYFHPVNQTMSPQRASLGGAPIAAPIASIIPSLTRSIGAWSNLNPEYLYNQIHGKSSQGSGYPLENKRVQQLPFPPVSSATAASFTFTGGSFTNYVSSPAELKEDGDWHFDSTGRLYCYTLPGAATVAYDLTTFLGDTYANASYNVIPDPSILRLNDGSGNEAARLSRSSLGEYGACKVTYVGSTAGDLTFSLQLPEVVSTQESVTDLTSDVDAFDPVGEVDLVDSVRRYSVSDAYDSGNEFNDGGVIADNTLLLFSLTPDGASYAINAYENVRWERVSDFVFNFTIAASTASSWVNDAGTPLTTTGSNTKTFFIAAIGTQITALLAQLRKNHNTHAHDGTTGARIQHSDLLGLSFLQPGLDPSFTLNGFDRVIGGSAVEENVHPQYMNRFGYRHGGYSGHYYGYLDGTAPTASLSDLNMLHGDLVFGPIQFNSAGGTPTLGSDTWDMSQSAAPLDLAKCRSHGILYGQPYFVSDAVSGMGSNAYGEGHGATYDYYEVDIQDQNDIEAAGESYSLNLHGLPLGDKTAGQIGDARKRGRNTVWGNTFFGFRSDLNGGAQDLDHQTVYNNEFSQPYVNRSTSGIFAEMNAIVTANGMANTNTENTNDFRENSAMKDGAVIQGVMGASVSLGVSNTGQGSSTGENSQGKTGAVSIEAVDDWGDLVNDSLTNLQKEIAGSCFVAVPRVGSNSKLPWAAKETAGTERFFGYWSTTDSYVGESDRGGMLFLGAFAPGADGDDPANLRGMVRGPEYPTCPTSGPGGKIVLGTTTGADLFMYDGHNDSLLLDNVVITDGSDAGGNQDIVSFNVNNWTDFQFRHKEFRLWGKPSGDVISAHGPHASGGNLNLMSNYGTDYSRFGLSLSWSDTNSVNGSELKTSAPWMDGRLEALGQRDFHSQSGHIRSAQTIEAWKGIRHDPLQPYVSTYVIPFKYRKTYNTQTSLDCSGGADADSTKAALYPFWEFTVPGPFEIDYSVSNSDLHIVFDNGHVPGVHGSASSDRGYLSSPNGTETQLELDQILRWHDFNLAYSQGRTQAYPGESLIDIDVSLNYYTCFDKEGISVGNPDNGFYDTDDKSSPNSNPTNANGGLDTLFDKVLSVPSKVEMLGASELEGVINTYWTTATSSALNGGSIPIRVSGAKGERFDRAVAESASEAIEAFYDSPYSNSLLSHPYKHSLNLFVTSDTGSGEANRIDWLAYQGLQNQDGSTSSRYGTGLERMQWGLTLEGPMPDISSTEDKVAAWGGSWPFRVYRDSTTNLTCVEVSGFITLKVIGSARYSQVDYQ